MIDERAEQDATLHALSLLSDEEAARFEKTLRTDAPLRALADELQASAARLAELAPPQVPASHIRTQLLAAIRTSKAPVESARTSRAGWLPWAAAAGFAVLAAFLTVDRSRMRQEIAGLHREDALSRLRIATLSAKPEGSPNSVGAVAWDSDKQRGVLVIEKLPPPGEAQDYQLWVIDPQYQQPVSGGIVRVDENGAARLVFTVDVPIRAADQFAISRERKGGVLKVEGPIVLSGK